MDRIFLTVLNMSLAASFVIAVVMLARFVLRRAPKIISYALWAVVLFNLLCSFKPESTFSLIPFHSEPIPEMALVTDADISFDDAAFYSMDFPGEDRLIPLNMDRIDASVNAYGEGVTHRYLFGYQAYVKLGSFLWPIGMAALLLYAIIGYIRLKRCVSLAVRVENNIFETDRIDSPFVLGLIRPRIYIPAGMEPILNAHIIEHERTHIRRRDYIVSVIAFLALALHWFNPLVWIAYMLMLRDMESSCDEAVLRKSVGDIRCEYSSALLGFSHNKRRLSFPLAFGEQSVKERIKNVLNFKKPSRIFIAAAVMLMLVLSAGFAVNRAADEPLIEMQMIYEENPAHFLKDMKLIWGDTVYYVTPMNNTGQGREIGYATDEISTWRIYELRGHGRDYLLAVESEDVWRVMSVYPPEAPWRQYILENATERQRMERLLSVTLFSDGTARLATPLISSYMLVGPYYYAFENGELLIGYRNNNLVSTIEPFAKFEVVDDDTIVFKSATVPLFADAGARYSTIIRETADTQPDLGPATASVDVAGIIERRLDIISASTPVMSSIHPYIQAQQADYDEIVALGNDALLYMFSVFEQGGQDGLRGHVMSYACRDILGIEFEYDPAIDTGQKWYDAYKQSNPTAFDPNLNQIYLGMTHEEINALFGAPDSIASGSMWFGSNNAGVFSPDWLSGYSSWHSGKHWSVYELVKAAVLQHFGGGTSGEYPDVWLQIVSMDANEREFTVTGKAQYELYIPDGEYDVSRVRWEYANIEMTFAKNADYDYVLSSSSIDSAVWPLGMAPVPMCYDEAILHFVGEILHSTRYGVNGFSGTIILTDIAAGSRYYDYENPIIIFFPRATLAVEGSNIMQYEGFVEQTLIIEFADPSKNITFGKDGVSELSAIPITEDLIGIFNVEDNRYEMKFERYVRE